VAAGIGKALSDLAGRTVRFSLAIEPQAAGGEAGKGRPVLPAAKPAAAVSQAALVREAAEHPLVAHARTLFDAAIRKVEPPRQREAAPAAAAAGTAVAAGQLAVAEDELDHSADEPPPYGEDHG
jgi:hypothetical protein